MTIIIANDFGAYSGGASTVALRSALGLVTRGHRVIFFTSIAPERKRLESAGIEVVECGKAGNLKQGARAVLDRIWNVSAAQCFAQLLDRLPSAGTVVHLHGWNKALSPSIVPLARSRHLPLICTLHDYAIACPRGTFHHLPRQSICELRPLGLRCLLSNCHGSRWAKLPLVAQRLVQVFPGQMGRAVDFYVAVSNASADRLRPHIPKHCSLTVIENPIQMDDRPTIRTRAEDNKMFVVIGRMSNEKGTLLAAQSAQQAQLPITFVGEGPAASEIAALGSSIHVTGWVVPDQVNSWLRRARALVFPSLMPETQGLVVLEAAALGIPALVGTRTAAASFVRHDQTGLHFKQGDAAALAAAMTRLAGNDRLTKALSNGAHSGFWGKPRNIAAHVNALETLYEKALRLRSDHVSRRQ